jgi:hypothetical protein
MNHSPEGRSSQRDTAAGAMDATSRGKVRAVVHWLERLVRHWALV